MTYVVVAAIVTGGKSLVISKSLAYAIIITIIDFDPDQFGDKIVMVDDRIAFKLKGRIYTDV